VILAQFKTSEELTNRMTSAIYYRIYQSRMTLADYETSRISKAAEQRLRRSLSDDICFLVRLQNSGVKS